MKSDETITTLHNSGETMLTESQVTVVLKVTIRLNEYFLIVKFADY